jgi:hypothetical protein
MSQRVGKGVDGNTGIRFEWLDRTGRQNAALLREPSEHLMVRGNW